MVEHLVYTDFVFGLKPLITLLKFTHTYISSLSRLSSSLKRKEKQMSTIRKHHNKWQSIIRIVGHPHIAKSFTSKTDAQRFAILTEAKLRREEAGISKMKFPKFEDAARRYIEEISSTKRSYRDERLSILRFLKESWSTYPLNHIKPHTINKWKVNALKTLSGGSVNRKLDTISTMFTTFKREWGYPVDNPVLAIRRPTLF